MTYCTLYRRATIKLGCMIVSMLLLFSHAYSGTEGVTCERICSSQGPAGLQNQVSGTIMVKILLVEFQDVQCRKDSTGRLPRYTRKDFEDLLGSEGTYVSPNEYSPDGDLVYGSMSDYYRVMSDGRVNIRAALVNRCDDRTGYPEWIRLRHTKQFYQDNKDLAIFAEAREAADSLGLDAATSVDAKLAIIYAGNTYSLEGGLNPRHVSN